MADSAPSTAPHRSDSPAARIGIQLMMLREHVAAEGVLPVLSRVRDTGFSVVEVSQIPMTETAVADLAAARTELGIEVAAISAKTVVPAGSAEHSLREDFDALVDQARVLDTDLIRIGMMPPEAMASVAAFDEFADEAEEHARRMRERGISLSYHNHHVEFARAEGQTLLERLRDRAPHLRFEIDCHWVQRGGRDPERTLAQFSGVLDMVHLKDFRIALPEPEVLAAMAAGDMDPYLRYWQGGIVQFAEVGEGTLDWAPIITQGIASGARHLLIEQDQTYGRDIFDSLALSRAHLETLGYGSLITG